MKACPTCRGFYWQGSYNAPKWRKCCGLWRQCRTMQHSAKEDFLDCWRLAFTASQKRWSGCGLWRQWHCPVASVIRNATYKFLRVRLIHTVLWLVEWFYRLTGQEVLLKATKDRGWPLATETNYKSIERTSPWRPEVSGCSGQAAGSHLVQSFRMF